VIEGKELALGPEDIVGDVLLLGCSEGSILKEGGTLVEFMKSDQIE